MHFSKEYQLFCKSGMSVTLLNAGASLVRIMLADRDGAFANVALPLKGMDDPSCAGMTVAPYAGRIAGGHLPVDGQTFQLSLNEGENHIHGGVHSLMRRDWRLEALCEDFDYQEALFSAETEDGLDGYPGNRRFGVKYRLYTDQRLEITLCAETDRPTRVNMTNHAYFNLSGDFSRGIDDHLLEVASDAVYENDDAFLPIRYAKPDLALDFSQLRFIGAPYGHRQLDHAHGLNHCYVLGDEPDKPAAMLIDPASGRRLRVYTDQPCMMVYSGGFLDIPNCAIALEAQAHPLTALAPAAPVLAPGDTYKKQIVYRFDTVM